MPSRSRTKYYAAYTSGSRKRLTDGQVLVSNYPRGFSQCNDFVGDPFNDHLLDITHKRTLQVGTLTGNTGVYEWFQYPYTNQPEAAGHYNILPNAPSSTAAATQVIADTNPSRPEVSMPNFLAELREIPRALHLEGLKKIQREKQNPRRRRRAGQQSNSAVESNFGWDLLISDLIGLTHFADQVDKRVKEVNALYAKGGLKRKRVVWSQVQQGSENATFHTLNTGISGQVLWRTYGRKWVTVRWKPDSVSIPSSSERLQAIRLAIHGWDFSLGGLSSTVWNALPWSWLIDYFGNVGDILAANRNALGCHVDSCCVMTLVETTGKHVITSSSSSVIVVPNSSEYTTKKREFGAVGFSATMPFLGAKQLATLSSIAFNMSQRKS